MSRGHDDRVRRLAGGALHMDVTLSAQIARQIDAEYGACTIAAARAVLAGYAEVYVIGVHYNPQARYAPFMPNGSMHAWCITRDGRLVDPSVSPYTVAGPGHGAWLAAYEFRPLAVATRGELRRWLAEGGEGHLALMLDRLPYRLPPGVAAFTDGPPTLESMEAATAARRALERGI